METSFMATSSKYPLIAAAVASVLGAGAAHALPPTASIDATIYTAGGSAQENAAFVAASRLMVASTIDIYSDNGATASGNYLVMTGTTNTAGSAALGTGTVSQNVLYFYKFNHGSFTNGVNPQYYAASNTLATLAYPNATEIAAAVTTGATIPATNPNTPTYSYTSAYANAQAPDFGLSDEEVTLFNNLYNLNNVAALSNITGNIKTDPIYVDVFGVAVTNAVYNGTSTFRHPKTSFTRDEVEGILAGAVTNWNQFFADDGTQLPSVPLWLLDRGSGSGSKAAGSSYFLYYPGAQAYGAAIKPNSVGKVSGNVNSGYTDSVLNLSGGYQDVEEPSNAQIVNDLITVNNNSGSEYAVSILAAQFAPGFNQGTYTGTNQYSFMKIGGVGIDTGGATDNINGTTSTSYTNVVTGAYDFAVQNSFNSRSNSPLTTTTTGAGWEAAMKTQLQASNLGGANDGHSFPTAVTGVLIDADIATSQVAGSILWTRNKQSASPAQISFDATSVNGGAITYGSDPLQTK
jgi:hypothetical protein